MAPAPLALGSWELVGLSQPPEHRAQEHRAQEHRAQVRSECLEPGSRTLEPEERTLERQARGSRRVVCPGLQPGSRAPGYWEPVSPVRMGQQPIRQEPECLELEQGNLPRQFLQPVSRAQAYWVQVKQPRPMWVQDRRALEC